MDVPNEVWGVGGAGVGTLEGADMGSDDGVEEEADQRDLLGVEANELGGDGDAGVGVERGIPALDER